jgi:DNA-binding MarR family transcriptional regulator
MLSLNMLTFNMTFINDLNVKLHKSVFLLDKLADKTLKDAFGLSASQFRILLAIGSQTEISQKDIADYWEMTEAAVSRMIDPLSDKKLIIRSENRDNRSKNCLKLSKHGLDTLEKGIATVDEKYTELYASLTQTEKKALETGLNKILGKLCPKGGTLYE